uniref:Thioredoxin domain-containing protein n=1 Tax=Chromera velia CCMP2878 TaxID=1169474 RepID=A0A0G4HA07_9ALVE|mmetsp:Transcript_37202/g.73197  ORF Transcript_37202/g.73197 Transcript_37202/m.73197 type:complete len:431 (+) Transcript_37202:177-1469(+)|eukprot:Cvel_6046.t1-p1 / transcript=Cvel_6046.t1 / gene=Cvel_6046 / organism=Chromera_velia_CCMP2878 / gene_product=Protein disulfide-isomerase A6, putative / transcript_product=Protein disulfide-isomerase A6, putative / location=Cvel_scaffold290:80611-86394(-) / protein_length=430 / sequence_SO=supercontig / SO=protein_coding / is_pseudo=false
MRFLGTLLGAAACSIPAVVTGLYSSKSPVQILSASDFKNKVINSDENWIVEFFASWCGHCKQLAPEYEKAAKALKGMVKVGAVEDQSVMGQYQVQGFPTIKWFGADNKNSPKDYQGGRTAADLVDFAMREAQSLAKARVSGKSSGGGSKKKGGSGGKSDVVVLTDAEFDKKVMKDESVWFVEFYAPWCGHCKNLAPAWEEVATELKGKIKVAKVDATVERAVASRFGIQGFPTLKLFPAGKKSDSSVQDYNGPRTARDLISYAESFYVANAKAEELLSDDQLKEGCASSLCVLAFLPHILDTGAKGRNKYLEDYNTVIKSSGGVPVKFFWLQGGDQFEFEETLALSFGFPALIGINLDKGYGVHRGDFQQGSIRGFLTSMMSGAVAINPIPKNLPKLQTVKPWDGKDAPPPEPEEDEYGDYGDSDVKEEL